MYNHFTDNPLTLNYSPELRSATRRFLIEQAKASRMVSSLLTLSDADVQYNPEGPRFTNGGYSDVFRGTLRGQKVCVKRLRLFIQGSDKERDLRRVSTSLFLFVFTHNPRGRLPGVNDVLSASPSEHPSVARDSERILRSDSSCHALDRPRKLVRSSTPTLAPVTNPLGTSAHHLVV
jgi:hypothetical protein